jgi:hypothetical protein
VDSAGAVTVTDDEVQAVSSVDLHDREMVRSSPQHRESRKIGSVQELTKEGGMAATRATGGSTNGAGRHRFLDQLHGEAVLRDLDTEEERW